MNGLHVDKANGTAELRGCKNDHAGVRSTIDPGAIPASAPSFKSIISAFPPTV